MTVLYKGLLPATFNVPNSVLDKHPYISGTYQLKRVKIDVVKYGGKHFLKVWREDRCWPLDRCFFKVHLVFRSRISGTQANIVFPVALPPASSEVVQVSVKLSGPYLYSGKTGTTER